MMSSASKMNKLKIEYDFIVKGVMATNPTKITIPN